MHKILPSEQYYFHQERVLSKLLEEAQPKSSCQECQLTSTLLVVSDLLSTQMQRNISKTLSLLEIRKTDMYNHYNVHFICTINNTLLINLN